MEEYLLVCKVLKPVGLKGQLKVYSYTSFKNSRYKKGNKLFYKENDSYKELVVFSHATKEGNLDLLTFLNYEDINLISPLLGKELYALKDEKILKKDEFYFSDLMDCKVIDEDNNELGIVEKVEEFPAQITLKISKKPAKTHFFVPFNDFFIKNIDIKNKVITIHLIEGLTD